MEWHVQQILDEVNTCVKMSSTCVKACKEECCEYVQASWQIKERKKDFDSSYLPIFISWSLIAGLVSH